MGSHTTLHNGLSKNAYFCLRGQCCTASIGCRLFFFFFSKLFQEISVNSHLFSAEGLLPRFSDEKVIPPPPQLVVVSPTERV